MSALLQVSAAVRGSLAGAGLAADGGVSPGSVQSSRAPGVNASCMADAGRVIPSSGGFQLVANFRAEFKNPKTRSRD